MFTSRYWRAAIVAAETAGLDFVVLPDSFALQQGGARVEQGRLDAVSVAAAAVAATRSIGLIPQASVTHTEPFHVAKAIASLDHASLGRAGWEVTVSPESEEADLFGRKAVQSRESLWDEAGEAVEVVGGLWDSWEDDAEIRDIATGRFIDREKLHYIDFVGEHFSVKGPSITPRPPQGQPPIAVRWGSSSSRDFAATHADLIRIATPDIGSARGQREAIHRRLHALGRAPAAVTVLLDVEVHLAATREGALHDVRQLESWAGHDTPPNSVRFVGSPGGLGVLLEQIDESGAADGVVLRPLAAPACVAALSELRLVRPTGSTTLRERIGLSRPINRFSRK